MILGITKKGITPVIAVVLLLMMTVGAAGGFYAYYSGMLDQFMSQTQQRQNTKFSIDRLSCEASESNVTAVFSNNGQTALDLSPVNIHVYQGDSEVYAFSKQGITLSSDGVSSNSDISTLKDLDSDFSSTNSRAGYEIRLDSGADAKTFEQYESYTVEFEFPQIAGGRTKSTTCTAE